MHSLFYKRSDLSSLRSFVVASAPFLPAEIDVNDRDSSSNQILFSLIRYVTETIRSVSVLFSDSEDEPADPNIIYEEPDDEASSSDKDVSLFYFDFLGGFGQEGQYMLSISPKRIPPPPCSHGPLTEAGPKQVGLGYRAVSAVGGDRGRACTVHSWGMIFSLIVGKNHSSIFEICLSRSITICSSNGPL